MQVSFHGATGTVTGSKYLFENAGERVLVDCGLFQGFKQIRQRNWQPPAFAPRSIGSVVLTHAHIDHTGYLPVLVRDGFAGPVYCSEATRDLAAIMLPDAAHLQEEEARYANRKGYAKHKPALPLFTMADAAKALERLVPVAFEAPIALGPGATARLYPAGHILGAGMVMIETGGRKVLFSGDLGRPNDPVMRPPAMIAHADALILESTYGNRRHAARDPEADLERHLTRALARGGVVIIPAFAVGRVQTLLYLLARLKGAGKLSGVPVYLNSPMAVDATRIYHEHRAEHRLTPQECAAACSVAQFVSSVEESKALNEREGPMIIVAASGMATGGRVVHHLKTFAPDPRNLILFSGFQAAGTRGAAMVAGAEFVRIHGEEIPVRAEVANLETLSAHADYAEILDWLKGFRAPPAMTFLTHGEPEASDQMRQHIERTLGWECYVPDYRETVALA